MRFRLSSGVGLETLRDIYFLGQHKIIYHCHSGTDTTLGSHTGEREGQDVLVRDLCKLPVSLKYQTK